MAAELQSDRKEELRRLRVDDGLSIKAIVAATGLSTGTVSKYCRGLRVNNPMNSNQKLASAAFAEKKRRQRESVVEEAKRRWEEAKKDPDLLSLVAFYWAEGSKRLTNKKCGHFVFTNSDPGAVKAVSQMLTKVGYNDQKLYIKVMPEQDLEKCRVAWERAIGHKVVSSWVAKRRSDSTRVWSRYGVCSLLVPKSSALWITLTTWISCWRSDLSVGNGWQD